MPLYEYHCSACDRDVEILVRSNEKPVCPECGGKQLEKLLSVPAGHVANSSGSLPMAPPGGFCGRGTCGMPGCGPG